ncbi:protein of unknown function [Aminobacter niigataensis]|nr:protein of unknown function [Aminobacter niigataensis]
MMQGMAFCGPGAKRGENQATVRSLFSVMAGGLTRGLNQRKVFLQMVRMPETWEVRTRCCDTGPTIQVPLSPNSNATS